MTSPYLPGRISSRPIRLTRPAQRSTGRRRVGGDDRQRHRRGRVVISKKENRPKKNTGDDRAPEAVAEGNEAAEQGGDKGEYAHQNNEGPIRALSQGDGARSNR